MFFNAFIHEKIANAIERIVDNYQVDCKGFETFLHENIGKKNFGGQKANRTDFFSAF